MWTFSLIQEHLERRAYPDLRDLPVNKDITETPALRVPRESKDRKVLPEKQVN